MNKSKKLISKLVLQDDYYGNDVLIYKYLNCGLLDKYIKQLNPHIIKCHITSSKKKYFDKEEQFIDLLHHFIRFFDNDFYYLGKYRAMILGIILEFNENYQFLLSNKYWGDNTNNIYFEKSIKKFIVTGFYNSLTYYKKSNIIKRFLTKNNIDIQTFNIEEDKNIEQLYKILKLLSFANATEFKVIYIFDDLNLVIQHRNIKHKDLTIDNEISALETMIKKYEKKEKFIAFCLDNQFI
ncbi:MAG: hypothetical protein IJ572_02970 [Bacilli bacterium]|nr:hypothetical protein [Bacilli bacterium]